MRKMLKDEILQNPNIIESFDPELKRAFDVADNEIPAEIRKPENVKLIKGKFRLSGDGVFYTIQGEGKSMGEPIVFIRLHVCNLCCVWCDAYYTWNPKSKEFWTESSLIEPKDLIKRIEELWEPNDKPIRVCFTGGEPLLQQETITELLKINILDGKKWVYEIETNGTIFPNDLISSYFQFNCSPKLKNSKNYDTARIKPEVLKHLNELNTQFKFVVMTNEDVEEVEKDFLPHIDKDRVILMPQGVTSKEVQHNAQNVVEIAKSKGYRLMDRLHVDIWGARRRV